MNLYVTGRAVLKSNRRLVMEVWCIGCPNFVRVAVTLETKNAIATGARQQLGVT